ncbi:secondary thiamine-phosphate synthase enzyme YjbQ [Candidatus Woesearchaeota archaeon]|nr:secondary thiamine-phosphate synthase enzyme YjbQ [Candidatus Woesearchaeota archaeon]
MMNEFYVESASREDVIDITDKVKSFVKNIDEGICVVFIPHATAGLVLNENADPNVSLDLQKCLNILIPPGRWAHDEVDNNGDSHIKSSIVGSSQTLIIRDGSLMLGTWQNIMLIDFDGPRRRKVIVKILEG